VSDFLAEMTAASVQRAHDLREMVGEKALESRIESAPPPLALETASRNFDVIAEAKLASPSEGQLVAGLPSANRVSDLAIRFADNGAAAISVLTEPSRFAGAMEHLELAAATVSVPVMRKDFLVDPIQIVEARSAGASGVLLIARVLPNELLVELTDLVLDLGMFALVEVFDRSDLETAVRVFDRDVLVGVNSRDLLTLEVDLSRFESLAPYLPDHLPAVAESGLTTPHDVAAVARLGYRMALVGSSLVTGTDSGQELSRMIAAGREAAEGGS
jgi:indole-3-glycerol phosphate synthase